MASLRADRPRYVADCLHNPDPESFFGGILPVGQQLRWGNEFYVFILIAASVFSYSLKAVLWTGFMGAVGWTLGFLWILDQPGN